MAITINTQPLSNDLLSPYRPIKITVTSDNNTSDSGTNTYIGALSSVAAVPNIDNFIYTKKVACYIYLDGNGTADNAGSPIILTPDFGTSYQFTFDISSYIAGLDTLTNDLQSNSTAISFIGRDTNSLKSIVCKFDEILYFDPLLDTTNGTGLLYYASDVVDSYSKATSNSFFCINGVWQYDGVTGSYDELNSFKIATTGNKYFLTNNRNTREIGVNDSEYLSGFTTLTGTQYLKLVTYGGKNGASKLEIYYLALTFNANRFDIPVGAANINATTGSWLNGLGAPRTDPTIDSTVGSYTIKLIDDIIAPTDISEQVLYNVDNSCSTNHTRIKFLNRLGAFEYFTFKGYKDRSITIRKNYYQQNLDDGYSIGSGGDRVLDIDSRTKFEVYSQPMKQADRIWLEELLEGYECFVEEGSNYIPIKVRAGETKIIDEGADLMTIKLVYEYANPNRRQNG
jgi:hypothetical protein